MPRVLVTGSREWTDAEQIRRTLHAALMIVGEHGADLPVLVHGGCHMRRTRDGRIVPCGDPPRGADAIADVTWRAWGLPVEVYFAPWQKFGKRAGFIRNEHMVGLGADLVCAFLLDNSPGTSNCIDLARTAGLRLDIIERTTAPSTRTRRRTVRPWQERSA